jgi:glycosyltransferase involved in cell wall biosynthesis
MIFVGSLKYSPVYKTHCCAFGKACEEEGYDVRYLFSSEYKWMLSDDIIKKSFFIGRSVDINMMIIDTLNLSNISYINTIISENKPTHVYMHNYHLLNHYIASAVRNNGGKFVYHVHEPYVENKAAHGGVQQYWLHINELMEEQLLRKTDIAIVSSNEASRLFDTRYPWFMGFKVKIPLIYENLAKKINTKEERLYLTFIGPPVPAKGPDILLDIVNFSYERKLNYEFLLITRSEILDNKYNKKNLKIYYKKKITDEEFGELINKSLLVITPYKRETQSSVVLVSYMYGTPVLSSNVGGLPEFVIHMKTGYLLDLNAEPDQWIKGIYFIQDNFSRLSEACREFFINTFSGKNWHKYLDAVLK